MYGCESWTINKAKHWRIDAFELWCWRRLLRVPWTARRSNESTLKEISPKYSLEGQMLKLKLQYFGHQMQRVTHLKRSWCWKRLKVGGEEDDRGWGGWMASPTQWMWELDYKESWELKNWCFWTVVLEKTLESPLDYKEIKPVNPKGNQTWRLIGRCWSWSSNTLTTWCKVQAHWERPWC